jgi:hypothetical protein
MQELRVLGRVLALAVVVALAWAMMGAGSRASLAHEPSATRSVNTRHRQRLRVRSVSFRGGIKYSTRGILPVPGFVALTTADQVST